MIKYKPTTAICKILRTCAELDVGKGVIMRPASVATLVKSPSKDHQPS